ncbi:glycogen synthase [Brumimicrobium salinarum]|uniref:starch synthase n=1 Tax=Brumimicrobium salinarum TaxID=2058658 RepID=A0A2I0R0R7_9FLAO|nr:glycogen/starch synthase [Brumimicrobium salinarum]PKR80182.1 glycogen synthase [Brumimicrobium salinarum]
MEKKRILFVSQEIKPFLPSSEVSTAARKLPQGVQESGKEIRVFMPRFGVINERRHQLHEVIRLSGMNLIVDDTDHPLIIKVASIPTARMQVYFIDNEEYFKRKGVFTDDKDKEYVDNDERSMFFCRGVLETVKKLGWKPDVIHCNGWMTSLMPLYVKDIYKNDPHFADTKVVYSLYDNEFNNNWNDRFDEKLKFEGFDEKVIDSIKSGDYLSLNKAAMEYSDGVVMGSNSVHEDLKTAFESSDKMKLDFESEEPQPKVMSEFFDKVIDEEALIQ